VTALDGRPPPRNLRRHHPDDQTGVNPLCLFAQWLAGAEGFTRPAPPPQPPLPLKFTCRHCGARLNPRLHRTHSCPAAR
jgi:hypothetical protein